MNNKNETEQAILSVRGLKTWFDVPAGVVRAVDGVSFDVFRGDILAIVGESGSGKSVMALSLLKLVSVPPGRYVEGEVRVGGRNVLDLGEPELEEVRGAVLSMLFQSPRASLDPSFTIWTQLVETLKRHSPNPGFQDAKSRALELLRQVGFDDPEPVAESYPHQLSGGMCQRVALALCMACEPRLLIADEPTTALDVGVQAKILLLLKRRSEDTGIPIIIITHDFGVVRAIASRVIVMYAGHVQEECKADRILDNPLHPYTKALIRSVPDAGTPAGKLYQIPGNPPDMVNPPSGCRFAPRCENRMERCDTTLPPLHEPSPGRRVRCHLFDSQPDCSA